jgi:hypothetical protein
MAGSRDMPITDRGSPTPMAIVRARKTSAPCNAAARLTHGSITADRERQTPLSSSTGGAGQFPRHNASSGSSRQIGLEIPTKLLMNSVCSKIFETAFSLTHSPGVINMKNVLSITHDFPYNVSSRIQDRSNDGWAQRTDQAAKFCRLYFLSAAQLRNTNI